MYVIDHKECGNRASFNGIGIDRSSAAQAGSIFDVKMFFRKTDGSDITVYRFQIDGGKRRKHVFRAVCSIAIMRKNQRTFVGDCVYGAFQEIALSEKRSIEGYSSDYEEEYAEQTEHASDGCRGDRPEQRKTHPEYGEDGENGIGLRSGNVTGSSCPENGFVVTKEGLYFPMEIVGVCIIFVHVKVYLLKYWSNPSNAAETL